MQFPPRPPQPIDFAKPEALALPVALNDREPCINRPTTNLHDFPPILRPGVNFYQWLMARRIEYSPLAEEVLRRDLELRRHFLMEGNLTEEEQQFIIAHISPAFDYVNAYMRALAGLALHSFDVIDPDRRHELAFALLFCISKLQDKKLINFIKRLDPF